MVEITNGKKTFRVPAGSVEVYKGMGFRVVKKGSEPISSPVEKEPVEETGGEEDNGSVEEDDKESGVDASDEEKFVSELLEKPISQWTNDEVKEFVRIKDIDTSGAQKVSQVRGIIKSYLEEQSKNA